MGIGLLLVAGIAYGIYYYYTSRKNTSTAESIGNTLTGKYKACDADMCSKKRCNNLVACTATASSKKPSDELFIDMQPPTMAHAGLNEKGSFDKDSSIIAALKAGIRSFTLQIDMLDMAKSNEFADPGVPTLLYRSADGSLLSANSGSIESVASAIANAAFQESVISNDEPVLLYLHIVRAPNQVREPAMYKAYLGKIATALSPLAPRHLGNTATGNYHRQLQEDSILTTPIRNFSGNVIILCNADTSVFKGDQSDVRPVDDLDYWVNMRVYALDSADKNIGIAQEYTGSGEPSAVIMSLDDIVGVSDKDALTFALKGKTRYVIAMPSENPDPDYVEIALHMLGVNTVPIDYFLGDSTKALAYMAIHDNMAWPEKIPSLRSN